MKKYIGYRQVEAEPMTKGEAYESGLLREFVVLNTKEKGKMGYHVKYEDGYEYCIPYNDETKHLVGTTDKAPEFYKYWED